MNYNALSIKSIIVFFISVIALTLIISTIIFIYQHSRLQEQFAYQKLHDTVQDYAHDLDREIKLAKQSVYRLKGHISLIQETPLETDLKFLQHIMTHELQLEHYYSNYFALSPIQAQQHLSQRGLLLLIHKDESLRDTARYHQSTHIEAEIDYDAHYANDPRNAWYYFAKQNQDIQITPIYVDPGKIQLPMLSISHGVYKKGRFLGVIGISFLVDNLFKPIETERLGKSGGLLLVDHRSGMLLSKVGDPGAPQLKFINASKREALSLYGQDQQDLWKAILNKDTPYQTIENASGIDYIVSSQQLKTLPWTLVSYQQSQEIITSHLNLLTFLILSLVTLGLLALMLWFLFKTLIRPLAEVLNLIKKIKVHPGEALSGNLGQGVIELKNIAEVFVQLASKIVKINSERVECIKRLQNSRLNQAEQTRKLEQKSQEISKIRNNMVSLQNETQQARAQFQKSRVEVQRCPHVPTAPKTTAGAVPV